MHAAWLYSNVAPLNFRAENFEYYADRHNCSLDNEKLDVARVLLMLRHQNKPGTYCIRMDSNRIYTLFVLVDNDKIEKLKINTTGGIQLIGEPHKFEDLLALTVYYRNSPINALKVILKSCCYRT